MLSVDAPCESGPHLLMRCSLTLLWFGLVDFCFMGSFPALFRQVWAFLAALLCCSMGAMCPHLVWLSPPLVATHSVMGLTKK